jgi:hypothetical protein
MNWIPYNNQKLDDNKVYMLCYLDFRDKKKYDTTRCKDGKPFIVGNYFAFDIVKTILAYFEIEEYEK